MFKTSRQWNSLYQSSFVESWWTDYSSWFIYSFFKSNYVFCFCSFLFLCSVLLILSYSCLKTLNLGWITEVPAVKAWKPTKTNEFCFFRYIIVLYSRHKRYKAHNMFVDSHILEDYWVPLVSRNMYATHCFPAQIFISTKNVKLSIYPILFCGKLYQSIKSIEMFSHISYLFLSSGNSLQEILSRAIEESRLK